MEQEEGRNYFDEVIECIVCFETYNGHGNYPMMANCGHQLCMSCIGILTRGDTPPPIICPQCRLPISDWKPMPKILEEANRRSFLEHFVKSPIHMLKCPLCDCKKIYDDFVVCYTCNEGVFSSSNVEDFYSRAICDGCRSYHIAYHLTQQPNTALEVPLKLLTTDNVSHLTTALFSYIDDRCMELYPKSDSLASSLLLRFLENNPQIKREELAELMNVPLFRTNIESHFNSPNL